MSKLTVCFATLCMLATPALATPKPVPAQTEQVVVVKKPASAEELDQYAARERVAEKLAKFEGGRGGGGGVSIVVVLLLVIIIILIV